MVSEGVSYIKSHVERDLEISLIATGSDYSAELGFKHFMSRRDLPQHLTKYLKEKHFGQK